MTTPTIKPGDRFEMTVRGEVKTSNGGAVWVRLDNGIGLTGFTDAELAAARITILEPELKVGRAVDVFDGRRGRILSIHGKRAWFARDCDPDEPLTYAPGGLRNIPEDE